MTELLAVLIVRATVLLGVACGLSFALRRASAATRHGVWTLAFGGLLVLPLATLALPRWELAILPGAPVRPAPPAAEVADVDTEEPARLVAGEDERAESAAMAAAAAPMRSRAARPAFLFSWRQALLGIWAAGALIGLGHVVLGSWLVRRLARRARPVGDAAWLQIADQAHASVGLRSPVRLLESDRVAVPVVHGLTQPVVLIPAGTHTWPAARRRAFLLHELAHVQRGDCLVQTMASLARALYWPHPLGWWAQRRLRAEAERASDDRVVAAGMDGSEYAHLLLEAARSLGRAPQPLAVVAIVERSSLEDRLLALLDPTVRRQALGRPARILGPAIAAALTALVAAVQPVPLAVLAQARSAAAPEPEKTATPAVAMPTATKAATETAAPRATPAAKPASAAPAAAEAAVEGTVTDERGKPIDDAIVLTRSETGGQFDAALHGRSDRSGRFRIPVADAAALYRVRVERDGWAPQVHRLVKLGTPMTLTLAPGATLEGVVLDKDTRKPVAGARIEARRAEERLLFVVKDPELGRTVGIVGADSDAQGRFRLGSLRSGKQDLHITAAGYAPGRWEAMAGEAGVELLLTAGAPPPGGASGPPVGTSMTPGAARDQPPRRSALDAEQLAALEKKLESKPDDFDARETLLRHYFLDRTPEGRAARSRHAMWVIENAPESALAGSPDTSFDRGSAEEQARARELWLKHLEKRGNDPKIVGNAARFFQLEDKERAEQLFQRAIQLDPEDQRWREQLAHFYMRDARGRRGAPPDSEKAKAALAQFEAALAAAREGHQETLLPDAAETALWAGDDAKAREYSRRALELAATSTGRWHHGNAVHDGHRILGHVALKAGEVEAAKRHLLESGKTPGSPQLNSFGPELTLARDLLAKGEGETVIAYLESIRTFWKGRDQAITEWVTLIRAGQVPELDRFRARRDDR